MTCSICDICGHRQPEDLRDRRKRRHRCSAGFRNWHAGPDDGTSSTVVRKAVFAGPVLRGVSWLLITISLARGTVHPTGPNLWSTSPGRTGKPLPSLRPPFLGSQGRRLNRVWPGRSRRDPGRGGAEVVRAAVRQIERHPRRRRWTARLPRTDASDPGDPRDPRGTGLVHPSVPGADRPGTADRLGRDGPHCSVPSGRRSHQGGLGGAEVSAAARSGSASSIGVTAESSGPAGRRGRNDETPAIAGVSVEPEIGFEPTTRALQDSCSTS